MKKPEEYLDQWDHETSKTTGSLLDLLADVQKDAWNAAVEACANEAKANLYGELGTIFLDRLERD